MEVQLTDQESICILPSICVAIKQQLFSPVVNEGHSNADTNRESSEKETIEIKEVGALGFIVVASAFLVLLFFFMSTGFVMLLNVMFAIAGSQVYFNPDICFEVYVYQGLHACLVSLISRMFKGCKQMKVNIPLLGDVTILAIVLLPLCIVFSILWVVNRHSPQAWVGQDILGICLMITVLRVLQLPNIKVASVLLCCAFCYDIFWVFISPLIFHESVMIAVHLN
ncbi:signal peptide peptidase-like 2 [Curcuma longa]|uniref:signal peptide peptidase-like 2 n=1 Tax=Curcuma longa TaxID=136217 RepID=UPI003D9DEE39